MARVQGPAVTVLADRSLAEYWLDQDTDDTAADLVGGHDGLIFGAGWARVFARNVATHPGVETRSLLVKSDEQTGFRTPSQ